jgi:hypothetical protein
MAMAVQFDGFDWDDGNWPKCGKHGLSQSDIEALFSGQIFVQPDMSKNLTETRYNAVGTTPAGRHAFLVFTVRQRDRAILIRPISARYMHHKEVRHYGAQIKP